MLSELLLLKIAISIGLGYIPEELIVLPLLLVSLIGGRFLFLVPELKKVSEELESSNSIVVGDENGP